MMEYREVYFRIRSAYQYDSGWPDKGAERAFREESRRLFQSAGWELHPARRTAAPATRSLRASRICISTP